MAAVGAVSSSSEHRERLVLPGAGAGASPALLRAGEGVVRPGWAGSMSNAASSSSTGRGSLRSALVGVGKGAVGRGVGREGGGGACEEGNALHEKKDRPCRSRDTAQPGVQKTGYDHPQGLGHGSPFHLVGGWPRAGAYQGSRAGFPPGHAVCLLFCCPHQYNHTFAECSARYQMGFQGPTDNHTEPRGQR